MFDKDDFTASQFQEAIDLANKSKIKCAYSIDSFELWFLLHFEYYDMALSREQYTDKLAEALGRPYRKNDDKMFDTLSDRLEVAIKNAKKLYAAQSKLPLARQNPVTTVFRLVEILYPSKPSPARQWFGEIGTIVTQTSDLVPTTVTVAMLLGHDLGDAAASELFSQQNALRDFTRSFFANRTADELTPVNEARLRREIMDILNTQYLSDAHIRDVIFTRLDVLESF